MEPALKASWYLEGHAHAEDVGEGDSGSVFANGTGATTRGYSSRYSTNGNVICKSHQTQNTGAADALRGIK